MYIIYLFIGTQLTIHDIDVHSSSGDDDDDESDSDYEESSEGSDEDSSSSENLSDYSTVEEKPLPPVTPITPFASSTSKRPVGRPKKMKPARRSERICAAAAGYVPEPELVISISSSSEGSPEPLTQITPESASSSQLTSSPRQGNSQVMMQEAGTSSQPQADEETATLQSGDSQSTEDSEMLDEATCSHHFDDSQPMDEQPTSSQQIEDSQGLDNVTTTLQQLDDSQISSQPVIKECQVMLVRFMATRLASLLQGPQPAQSTTPDISTKPASPVSLSSSPIQASQQRPSSALQASQPMPSTSSTSSVHASNSSGGRITRSQATSPTLKRARPSQRAWVPLTEGEMYAFIGSLIIMGYNQQPELAHYWCLSSDLGNFAIRTALTRVRFNQIWNHFRISDEPSFTGIVYDAASPRTQAAINLQRKKEDQDAIMKLRPLMERINRRFRQVRAPSSNLCIDESMTAYKGRSKIKICQPKKPIKWGFEHFTLCDASNGYILNDEAHIGKKRHMKADPRKDPEPGLEKTSKMAHTTIYTARHYLKKGYNITFDNRFTSTILLQTLYENQGTFAVGSIRGNAKNMPSNFKTELRKFKGTGRGDYTMRQSGRLLFTAWHDTRTVSLLSTCVEPHAQEGTVDRRIGGRKRPVRCPAAAVRYTESMNGVDIANHLVSSFHVGRRSRVWHRYLFFQKLNQVLVNARINFLSVSGGGKGSSRSQLSFRRALASQLLVKGPSPRLLRIQTTPRNQHHLEKGIKSRRCHICQKLKKRHESIWWCSPCKTNVCDPKKRNCFALHKEGLYDDLSDE
jgi:hypothetical protein